MTARKLSTTIFVVDDDAAVRDSLLFLMRAEGLMSRSYDSAESFLQQLRPDHAGCIVTDVKMPGMDGVALVEALKSRGCRMPVIVMSGHADVATAVKAMKAGAHDFVQKPFESSELLDMVRTCLTQTETEAVAETKRRIIADRVRSLTQRERQVLTAVFNGRHNRQIAAELGISSRTVEIFRANVMSKMQCASLPELVKLMVLCGTPEGADMALAEM
jgi:two-component system response regulator FixJ